MIILSILFILQQIEWFVVEHNKIYLVNTYVEKLGIDGITRLLINAVVLKYEVVVFYVQHTDHMVPHSTFHSKVSATWHKR